MDEFRGKLRTAVPLALHTSWKVGGIANCCYQPFDIEELAFFLKQLPQTEPVLFLGLGSNTLISDKGFNGTVVLLKGGVFNSIQRLDDTTVRVEAGVASPFLARWCAKQGLNGLAFLAGIPGTIGGALAMNAGAYGSEIWDFVSQVEVIDREGNRQVKTKDAYRTGYRTVSLNDNAWFIACELSLQKDQPAQCQNKVREVINHRTMTQPNKPSAGSVFKNPINSYAGKLIEQCGLKGMRLGGAMVSQKHANFIINRGHAKSGDIESLIDILAKEVKKRYDIILVPEVHIY